MTEDQIIDLIKKKEDEEECLFNSQFYNPPPELKKYDSDNESQSEYHQQNCKRANVTTKDGGESSIEPFSFQNNGQYENDGMPIEEIEYQHQQEDQHSNQESLINIENSGEILQKRVKLISGQEEFQDEEDKQFQFGEFQNIKKKELKQEECNQNQLQAAYYISKENEKDQNFRIKIVKVQPQSIEQKQNVGLALQTSLQQEHIQNSSLLNLQPKKADQNNEVIEAGAQMKIQKQTLQISKILQQIQKNETKEKPQLLSKRMYENFERFIKKKSKWKCFLKYSPNVLVHLICQYAGSLKQLEKVIIIYDRLVAHFQKMDEDWIISFNLNLQIKIQSDQIDKSKIDKEWIIKENANFYLLCNFKKLCQGIAIDFKKTEYFIDVNKKLNNQLEKNVSPKEQEQINKLKYVVTRIEYLKYNKLMKKIVDFDQSDIKELYKVPEIKEQVDNIYQKIVTSPQSFSEYNSITGYDTQKSNPKKTNTYYLQSLIEKINKAQQENK